MFFYNGTFLSEDGFLDSLGDLVQKVQKFSKDGIKKSLGKKLSKSVSNLEKNVTNDLSADSVLSNPSQLYQPVQLDNNTSNIIQSVPNMNSADTSINPDETIPVTDTSLPTDPNATMGMEIPDDPLAKDISSAQPVTTDPLASEPLSNLSTIGMLSATDLGKIYILKKAYSKLLAIKDILSKLKVKKYEELNKLNDDAIEHFRVLIDNFDLFKDKLDVVIDLFQKFIVSICDKLEEKMHDSKQ